MAKKSELGLTFIHSTNTRSCPASVRDERVLEDLKMLFNINFFRIYIIHEILVSLEIT